MALITALIWGTAFVAQDLCAGKIGAFTFNALRAVIAVLGLGAFLLIRRGIQRKKGTYRKQAPKSFWLGGLVCGFFLAVASNLQQFGISDSGAGKASFITALYVVLVPVFSMVAGRKNPVTVWIGVAAAAVGMYFLCIKGNFTVAKGDFFLIACAVAFALQVLSVDHFVKKVDSIALSWGQFLFAAIFSGVFALIFDTETTGAGIISCLLPVLYVGVFSSCIAYTLQVVAQVGSNPTVIALIFSLESVFGVAAGALLLQERLLPREYFGCALMLLGVVVSQLPFPQKKTN